MLYQRYFLRMNQSNTTNTLGLLLGLVLSLAAVYLIFIPLNNSNNNLTSTNLTNLISNGSLSNKIISDIIKYKYNETGQNSSIILDEFNNDDDDEDVELISKTQNKNKNMIILNYLREYVNKNHAEQLDSNEIRNNYISNIRKNPFKR